MANRGTKKSVLGKAKAWAGDQFKKDEEKRLKKTGVEFVSSGRGTKKIAWDDKEKSKKRKYKGKVSTGRGTGTR